MSKFGVPGFLVEFKAFFGFYWISGTETGTACFRGKSRARVKIFCFWKVPREISVSLTSSVQETYLWQAFGDLNSYFGGLLSLI